MVSGSQEKRLLEASKGFDKAIQDRDQAAVEALFAENVTVHKGAHRSAKACMLRRPKCVLQTCMLSAHLYARVCCLPSRDIDASVSSSLRPCMFGNLTSSRS